MKEVIAIYVKGKFKQYLMKSEVRLLIQACNDFGEVSIKLTSITKESYKKQFGK